MPKSTTEIVPFESYALVNMLKDGDFNLKELIDETLGDEGLSIMDLERVTVPSGGSTTWIIGETETKTLDAVIIHSQTQRTYWEDPNSAGTPPDCFSPDARNGVFGECASCEFAKFGSAVNKSAQACKLKRVLFLLMPDSIMPIILNIPPASLKDAKKYLVKLIGSNKKTYEVVTRMTLSKEKNADGQAFSKVHFDILKAEKNQDVVTFVKAMRPMIIAGLNDSAFVPDSSYTEDPTQEEG